MVYLIAGCSHVGKTLLAQKLLERYHVPYLSIDHLKMGLIRSGYTSLTPESPDEELTGYLWPVVREIIKTAIENGQDLTVEGCYIPFSYREDFESEYLERIRYVCLIFSPDYIESHYEDILRHASVIEERGAEDALWCTKETLLKENRENLRWCRAYDCPYFLIDGGYRVDPEEIFP